MRQVKQPPDADNDCDVDLSDFSVFSLCFGGSGNPPGEKCPPGINFDLDCDGDVDGGDFSRFSLAFTGPLTEGCPWEPCAGGESAQSGAPSEDTELLERILNDPVQAELFWKLAEYCRKNGIPLM